MKQRICTYKYPDIEGNVLLRKHRYRLDPPGTDGRDKTFSMQGRCRPDGAWDLPRRWVRVRPELGQYWDGLLFGLPELVAVLDDADSEVVWTEGEKDACAATAAGAVAVSIWQGAVNTSAAQAAWFRRYPGYVVLAADLDPPGAADALRRYDLLLAVGIRPSRIEVRRAAVGNDVSDHLAEGLGLDELVPVDWPRMREVAAAWAPAVRRGGY
jgi:hypothetical protein